MHCWRPEFHQHGDRTASVGIRKTNNTIKCFGCGIGPLSVVDLVMAVLDFENPGDAARWVAQRFDVPEISTGKHVVEPDRRIFQYGSESEIGLLIRCGLWPRLSVAARALAPVLLEFAEPQTRSVTISFQAMKRYSGIASPNAISAALRELEQIHWLSIVPGRREPGSGPVRTTSTYVLTPRSDELMELANANCKQMREEIEIQRQIRAAARAKRRTRSY
jgi:DNA-binding HxlR family transcriptional regulator